MEQCSLFMLWLSKAEQKLISYTRNRRPQMTGQARDEEEAQSRAERGNLKIQCNSILNQSLMISKRQLPNIQLCT